METGIISIGDASREISKSEKLNEPSEDIPFIRGMDSNGNPIYIGTEQFSSVLAGLMGVGFLEKVIITILMKWAHIRLILIRHKLAHFSRFNVAIHAFRSQCPMVAIL